MKTKELIRQLQDADPSGETEVCIGNADINFVDVLPAYYDGRLQVLQRNENNGCYNIIGAKLVSQGNKVIIHPLSIYDALWNDPDMPIDYSDCSEQCAARYKESHDKTRQQVRECESKLELQYFLTHVKHRVSEITEDSSGVEERARDFFLNHLSYKDSIPDDIPREGESYITLRNKQWERQIDITYDGSDVILSMRETK